MHQREKHHVQPTHLQVTIAGNRKKYFEINSVKKNAKDLKHDKTSFMKKMKSKDPK
jgi:hypothetical protein